jgi:hypothetical protein
MDEVAFLKYVLKYLDSFQNRALISKVIEKRIEELSNV